MVGPQPLQPLSEILVSQLSEAKREGSELILTLSIRAPGGSDISLGLLNPFGKSVLQQNIKAKEAAQVVPLDLGQLPLGVYFLSVEVGSANKVIKLVISDEGAQLNPGLPKRGPAKNALQFQGSILHLSSPSKSQLDIHNMLGHKVGGLTVQGNQDFDVNKWNLPPGLYLVKLRTSEGSESTVKITVSR
jgi:hypothetical protein